MSALHWTRPFCGLTHGYRAELTMNNPGFPFKIAHHDTVELAKAAGEAWMAAAP